MRIIYFLIFITLISSCSESQNRTELSHFKLQNKTEHIYHSRISSNEFFASYKGADFVDGDDIAHQLSNFVADSLGKHLKSEFKKGKYKKVDFKNTIIETYKYHPDSVYYSVKMPLLRVDACEAFTCVDHRGSWISLIKKTDADLNEFIAKISVNPNHKEEVKLFTTEFGLYEYWVQFRHPILQENCK
jgi:hypothetical protein